MPESSLAPDGATSKRLFATVGGHWVALFLISFALYAATANRGPQWQDSGGFILRITTGKLINPLGLALSHPLHHWLGRLAMLPGLVEPCFAITLVSAVGAALAVANTYGCVRTLTASGSAALFAAASLALAATFWQLATIAESYTFSAALLAGECWCLVAYAHRRRTHHLWGMLLFNGLGLANHLQALLTTPVLAVIVLDALRRKHVSLRAAAIGGGLWLVGSLPYTGLVVAEWVRSGDFAGTASSALFGVDQAYAAQVLNTTLSPRGLASSVGVVAYNFPNLLLPAAVYGIVRGKPKRLRAAVLARRALLAGLILHAGFAFRYNIVDQHTFFLPLYVLLATFGGMGAAATFQWARPRRRRVWAAGVGLLLTTPLVYLGAAGIARKLDLLSGIVHNKPYRDDYTYLFIPWSVTEHSAERMSSEALHHAGPRGLIIVEDTMARSAIAYQALRAEQDELEIRSVPPAQWPARRAALTGEIRRAADEGRPVVLVPLNRDRPQVDPPIGTWRREGDLYVLEGAGMTTGHPPRPPSRSIERR